MAFLKLRKTQTGYATLDSKYLIERDVPSIGDFDEPGDPLWFVYDAAQPGAGIPDALYEGKRLRDCRTWILQREGRM